MKINGNKIYDVQAFSNALTEQLNLEAPTFKALYPSDTATSLVNVLSSYGAMLEYQIVSAMANCYTNSAYSEMGIHQLAETLGNRLHGNISSQIICDITRKNLLGISGIMIPKGSKFVINNLNFFNPENIIFPLQFDTITGVKLIQGDLITNTYTSSGISGEKIYFSENFSCNTNLVEVYINGEQWTIADSFLPYVITDNATKEETNVVVLRTDPDGRSYIKFGNNTNGIVPSQGSQIEIKYISNIGEQGNLESTNLDVKLETPIFYTTNSGNKEQLEVIITTTSTASGGFNSQSLNTLRESSPFVFASGQRAVRRNDYKAMLLNNCGYLTCNVWGEYEEAMTYGGYDKIMMNMVYYTGIKYIQKYDLQPIGILELNSDMIKNTEIDPKTNVGFISYTNNISSARGFIGSYIIDISSYTINNTPISLKFIDKYGTGILVYDSNANPNITTDVFPINDWKDDSDITINTNQDIKEDSSNPNKLKEGGYKSSGIKNEQNVLVNFDYPFQIKIDSTLEKNIAGFAFQCPTNSTDAKHFIGRFAIYATNDPSPNYDNIKNNSKWTRICEMQSFDFAIQPGEWSNWVTTNLYKPGTSTDITKDLSSQITGSQKNFTLTNDIIGSKFKYTVKLDGVTLLATEYSISDNTLTLNNAPQRGSTLTITATYTDWIGYKHFVIEIYSIADKTVPNQNIIAINKIKTMYSESASTIWYENNNQVTLKLPVIEDEDTNVLTLPTEMEFYQYNVTINGFTLANGYKNGDIVSYTINTARGQYIFRISAKNLLNNQYLVELLSTGGGTSYSNILRGKEPLVVNNGNLIYTSSTEGQTGSGATITINSISTMTILASYTGNFYSNSDIQAFDLPIIDKYNHFTTYLEFRQPRIKNINIEVSIEYENNTDYTMVKNQVIDAITKIFDITPYYIGSPLNVSTIWKAINSVNGVKRFIVTTPQENINCEPFELITLPKENLIIHDILTEDYK